MYINGAEIEIIRSSRKSVSIEIADDLHIRVRAPYFVPDAKIHMFIISNEQWIKNATERKKEKQEKYPEPDAAEELRLRARAAEILPEKIKYWSLKTGLAPTGIKVTGAKTRFGSCSGKNSLCFSYLLMRYPEEAIDYVVLHEIAHIKHHNHSKDFYDFIAHYMPDYRRREKMLRA